MTGSASGRSSCGCCEAGVERGSGGEVEAVGVTLRRGRLNSQFLLGIDAKIGTLFGVPFRTPQKGRPEYAREEYQSALASGRYFSLFFDTQKERPDYSAEEYSSALAS